ncbi:hypothetical protein ACH5RR_015866 [Cinchona calisaya]|uniref:Uncharacterized protein n=1 Tax=Cinchona calisaya TaxID=153742 RepID=A0ABD2ZUC2_9GENT
MASMEAKNEMVNISFINENLKGQYFYFQIRVSFFESARGTINRYNIVTCLAIQPEALTSPMDTNANSSAINKNQLLEDTAIVEAYDMQVSPSPLAITSPRADLTAFSGEASQQATSKASAKRTIFTKANIQHKYFKTD